MAEILEYYLTGGTVRIGKKEFTLELLRKDSILRVLFGFDAGNLSSLLTQIDAADREEYVTIDFNRQEKRKLSGDPASLLNELKARYGSNIGGLLSFQLMYTTFNQFYHLHANLDADTIVLETVL